MPSLLKPGQHVGPYRIERLLGSGGMGVVALAYDPALERHVALKVIRREMLSAELLRRFETARRVLARLEHPHIARIFDGGTLDDLPYFGPKPWPSCARRSRRTAGNLPTSTASMVPV